MFEELISEFEKIPRVKRDENWFSICGFPHYEKVASNVLQFFLDSSREHGLGDLFIKSILSFSEKYEFLEDEYFSVTTEFQTKKGNFIDLILTSETLCIVIENKIKAWIYNDLNDYFETAKEQAPNVYAIVLSLVKQTPSDNRWTYITYSELFEKVRNNIGAYITIGNRRYLNLCFEFIENIENLIGNHEMDENFINFLSTNTSAVQELIKKTNEVRNELRKKVQRVGALIIEQVNDTRLKQWEWRKGQEIYDVAVSDIQHPEGKITVHSELFLDGWKFSVFTRENWYPIKKLSDICIDLDMDGNVENGRFKLNKSFDFSVEEQTVSEFSSRIILAICKKCLPESN
ncbi:MAG: PD-(D/E)XK nuclease family protein [Aeromonadaceae bacterium]